MKTTLTAATPHAVLAEVERHYASEGPRLQRLAGLTTGAMKKRREAEAAYADQQAAFWANVDIEEPSDLAWSLVASRLMDALKGLVTDVADYPAWQRPCLALDRAHEAIAEAEAFIKKDPA